MEELRGLVRSHPVLDNHAHNLLRPALQDDPKAFRGVTSEALDDALDDSVHALAHLRARTQLMELYEVDNDDWDSLMRARSEWLEHRPQDLYRKCFDGTHTVLMDDGLIYDDVWPFPWHDQWTVGPTKRIFRIEAVAETLMRDIVLPAHARGELDYSDLRFVRALFADFERRFTDEVKDALASDQVVGFKSIVCYRSGLDVELSNAPSTEPPLRPFVEWLETYVNNVDDASEPERPRLNSKPLNDWLVILTLSLISESQDSAPKKPIQFHTGLGDDDIQLVLANPAYLQPLIAHYPKGYLATVYSNAYLDLGLVFPMVSKAGQASILTQAFEITPYSKLLYSSDGNIYPESYYLSLKQFREVFEEVLIRFVDIGSLTTAQASDAARKILFDNSNSLYNLNINLSVPQDLLDPTSSAAKDTSSPIEPGTMLPVRGGARSTFRQFLHDYPDLAFVYIQWWDYMGTMRARILPVEQFQRVAEADSCISISRGNTGTLQNDFITPAVNTTGHVIVVPDLNSLRPTHRFDTLRSSVGSGQQRSTATVMSSWCDEKGNGLPSCPRKQLLSILNSLRLDYNMDVKLGFEIEVTFLDRAANENVISPVTKNHAWSTMSPEQWYGLGVIRDVYDGLKDIGVEIQQIHAESGTGQYEFVLPPAGAVPAIDMVLQARQVIRQIAFVRGLRATMNPKLGNGAHVHMSLNQVKDTNREANEWRFFAGILARLRAVCAFTLPEAVSYERVVDDHWSGGTWVAWGTQNRECPLRRVTEGHWEYRALDGMSNLYLALAAVLGAGLLGLQEGMVMKLKDCAENPSRLTDSERRDRGIEEGMPKDLASSMAALGADPKLRALIGETLVDDYVMMKGAEQRMLGEMSEEDRHEWLIERY